MRCEYMGIPKFVFTLKNLHSEKNVILYSGLGARNNMEGAESNCPNTTYIFLKVDLTGLMIQPSTCNPIQRYKILVPYHFND